MFSFGGRHRAAEVLPSVMPEIARSGARITALAIVERDAVGEVRINQPSREQAGRVLGAAAGGLLGIFGGPVGIITLAMVGGVAGGIAGHFAGTAIAKDDLNKIAAALPNDSSAIVAIVDAVDGQRMIDQVKDIKATVVTIAVGAELSEIIESVVAAENEAKPETGDISNASPSAAPPATGVGEPPAS
jgi:uncharacterized membrane protein